MDGWILEQDEAGRKVDVAHDDVHRGAVAGPVDIPIRQLGSDVLVATQRVEVVLLVVIERRFVAQPLPDEIRVVVDLEVARVVVALGGVCCGHGYVFRFDTNSFTSASAVSASAGDRLASGRTTSPTRLRYDHAISGGKPPQSGD